MYVSSSEMVLTDLRQGDIIKDVQIFGAINYGSVHFITNQSREDIAWQSNTKPTIGYAIVLSHSCEIARENGVKLTSIVLAPLRDIETASRPEKIAELIASNKISLGTEFSYLKYYYLEPNPFLPYGKGSIVDFSKTFSIKKDSYNYLLSHKVLQLDYQTQDSLAIKYALFYYRTPAV